MQWCSPDPNCSCPRNDRSSKNLSGCSNRSGSLPAAVTTANTPSPGLIIRLPILVVSVAKRGINCVGPCKRNPSITAKLVNSGWALSRSNRSGVTARIHNIKPTKNAVALFPAIDKSNKSFAASSSDILPSAIASRNSVTAPFGPEFVKNACPQTSRNAVCARTPWERTIGPAALCARQV